MSCEAFFSQISSSKVEVYKAYWSQLIVKDDEAYFKRWLFAILSVHTTWESNVRGYNSIKNRALWNKDKNILKELLIKSKCGMHFLRAEYIWELHEEFWRDPTKFYRLAESSEDHRERLTKLIRGLSYTKVSFALEISFPLDLNIICLDVHMLKFLNGHINSVKKRSTYEALEIVWQQFSNKYNVPPVIARAIYWDELQKKEDSSYWVEAILAG